MNLEKLSTYSPLVLRIGIALVFLWFGFSQIKNPAGWTKMVPSYLQALMPFSPSTLIYFNGVLEIILAALLLLGLYTRLVAFLLSLHLLHIVTIVGYGAVGARDLALTIATASVFLHGTDAYSLDFIRKKDKIKDENKESAEAKI
ncbi:MAG: DoxX family membrane protein [Nanoarchaeota archaeon]